MESFFFRKKRSFSTYKFESPESNSNSMNKKEIEKGIEKEIIKNKTNKKISTSFLQSNKKLNKNNLINDEDSVNNNNIYIYDRNNKKLKSRNSCPLLIMNNYTKLKNKLYNVNQKGKDNEISYPTINKNFKYYNYEYKGNKLLKKNNLSKNIPFYLNKGIKTFYKANNVDFLLDKRIQIIKKPQMSETNYKKSRNKNVDKNQYELEFNYRYQKMFDRKLPLNDLRNYKTVLIEDSKILRENYNQKNKKENEKLFTNTKIDLNTKNSKKNINSTSKNDSQNIENNENNNNFETIELHGVITKVMTKLQKDEFNNNSKIGNKKEDFHTIMKHPLLLETFGYKFLRNLNKKYTIFKNPLDDKDLIQKIHHLIINPNTKEFRNGNLMYNSAGFYKNKNKSCPSKNYKLLSKKGYIRLKNSKINRFKQDIEDNFQHIEEIKEKINLLMEKNHKIFKEHKEDIENEEKQ